MSRIDKFLHSESWCIKWPNMIQRALLRCLSDHCPIMLKIDEGNWGPRLQRMLKCWTDLLGYHLFVKDKWNFFQVSRWEGYVHKEK